MEKFFFLLKKEEIFKLNQQLKGTMENSPIKLTHFQRLDSHSKFVVLMACDTKRKFDLTSRVTGLNFFHIFSK